jgi:hypothetical protein
MMQIQAKLDQYWVPTRRCLITNQNITGTGAAKSNSNRNSKHKLNHHEEYQPINNKYQQALLSGSACCVTNDQYWGDVVKGTEHFALDLEI